VLADTSKNYSVPTHRRGIGYVPQDLALFPHLSVRQNLLYGSNSGGAAGPLFTFEHVVEVLEIQPLISRGVTELSGGEKQRVALARALLVFAAPAAARRTAGQPRRAVEGENHSLPARVRDEFRIPMLCVTHDRFEALALADEIVVLVDGKVMQTGPVLGRVQPPGQRRGRQVCRRRNLQPGQIASVNEGLATVSVNRATLTALAPATASREVFVCIRGEDVILQREPAVASSVRNRLSARIVALRTEGALVRVELDAGFPLFALITRPACIELALREGEQITALIKTPAIHLVPR
jgi:molybdate transport system ATP-binding protein